MPVVIQYTSHVGVEEYDQVAFHIRFHDEVPPGLLIHTAAVTESGHIRVFDVWRTQEDHDRFAENRLRPAIAEVVGSEVPEAELEVLQLHSVVGPLLT